MDVPGVAAVSARYDRVRSALLRRARRYPALDHLLRAQSRFGEANGGGQSAAVTYFGFLSFFPLVALAFGVLGYLVEWQPELHGTLARAISAALPGLVGDGPAQVNVDKIAAARGGAGVLGVAGLAWAGTAWVDALRSALQMVLRDDTSDQGNLAWRKLRDLGLLLLLGGAALISVGLSTVATLATGRISAAADLPGGTAIEWLIRLAAIALAVAGSTCLFAAMFAGLCGTELPRGDLWRGAVLAAVGFEVLKLSGTVLLGNTMRNPVYVTFSVAVGMLVWINFVSRLTLFAAAWTATFRPVVTGEQPNTDVVSAQHAETPAPATHP